MDMLRNTLRLPALAGLLAIAACNGGLVVIGTDPASGSSDAGTGSASDPNNPIATGASTASKVDLLLVVDDSNGMADKAQILSKSIPALISNIATAGDVHVGVIATSLGTPGGDVCPEAYNRRASLSKTAADGAVVSSDGVLTLGKGRDALIADTQALVLGIGENGCGLEAQLESTYRFLIQPDPWNSVVLDSNNQTRIQDTDTTLLAQRASFLRPDSLVLVVLLTDEDDSIANPHSIAGQGWAFMNNTFPGSTSFRADGKTTTAPRGTSACDHDPGDAACTSCAFGQTCDQQFASCVAIRNDPNCAANKGYYAATDDDLNVRFFDMKRRFGVDPQYPVSRYIDGFTRSKVPDFATDHPAYIPNGTTPNVTYDPYTPPASYLSTPTCTNPLFAAALPSKPGDELCNLPVGPRGADLVVFTVIGGVPEALVGAGFTAMLGKDPSTYDFSGIDPHMVQSIEPRAGLPAPSTGGAGSDPIHGREWNTNEVDLQNACTFTLPTPRTCAANDYSCFCANATDSPICEGNVQVRGRALPSRRPIEVVKGLGANGIVGSICPSDLTLGYDATMTAIAARIAPKLTPRP